MEKPDVVQLPNGEYAVVRSVHATKGAADKAVNEMLRSQRRFNILLTEEQVQKIIDALTS